MDARTPTTVVGGGLAGLIAAIEVAEAGHPVRLLEARSRLGGRATSSAAPFAANLGPHALYTGTALWDWLVARGLHRGFRQPRDPAVFLRWQGRTRRLPPREVLPILRLRRASAPIDLDFRTWLGGVVPERSVEPIVGAAGNLTFDHDPGRLSAAFVLERIQRITINPRLPARYVPGGWSTVVDRLAAHAAGLGVAVETGAKVEPRDLDGFGPTIVAVEPNAARRLLGDDRLEVTTTRTALLDIGIEHRRGDAYVVVDLDEAGFSTRPSAIVDQIAPGGQSLVQLSIGMRPGETLEEAERRLESLADAGSPGWRDRTRWRRRSSVQASSGAIDLPGTSWRDRPAIGHADGVWLVGDWVAAPGHLAEVACNSAVSAAREVVDSMARLSPAAGRAAARR